MDCVVIAEFKFWIF